MTPNSTSLVDLAERWLAGLGHGPSQLTPLPGDVSPRKYLRLEESAGTSIVAYYPEAMREAGGRFVRTTELLSRAGVPVPGVHAWDPAAGFMLLADAGRLAMHDAVARGADPLPYWRSALGLLARLGRIDPAQLDGLSPPLGAETLRHELVQTWDLVLEPRGLVGPRSAATELRRALYALCDRLAGPTARPCHRDFMARNLLLDAHGSLVVIDHQDLRLGPPWYDLASLLNDTLYADPLQETALLDLAAVPNEEIESYHRAAAQRALKIAGTFAAFAARGSDRYLALIPASLDAARRHLRLLPETRHSMDILDSAWDSLIGSPTSGAG